MDLLFYKSIGMSSFEISTLLNNEILGGQGSWRTSLTLPNILKIFNPDLIGYSLRTSITLDEESQFNVAEGGAISSNMPYMAKVLVKRIKTDSRVNLQRDWKVTKSKYFDWNEIKSLSFVDQKENIKKIWNRPRMTKSFFLPIY